MREDGYWWWQQKIPAARPTIVLVSGDYVMFHGTDYDMPQDEAEERGTFLRKVEEPWKSHEHWCNMCQKFWWCNGKQCTSHDMLCEQHML